MLPNKKKHCTCIILYRSQKTSRFQKDAGLFLSCHSLSKSGQTIETMLGCSLTPRTTDMHKKDIVRRLRGRKHHNCSFCDKRTIFTGTSPFNMTIHIRYGGISEINPDSRKFKIS